MPLAVGDILQNRYRIEALLGEGGSGAVYRALDQNINFAVAIKENQDTSAEAHRQFELEAGLLVRLRHPSLPRVTDTFFIPEQGHYLVLDFVAGQDLQEMIRLQGPLDEARALAWMSQVLDALSYLHSQKPPIIHRDVKPANIRVTPDGRAVLVDFGIAKLYDPSLLTTQGARAVTPGYSPLEQYGQGGTDARSDVYAVGATLYTLLTGKVPPESIALASGTAKLVSPRIANPSLSPQVETIILRAMTNQSTRRYADARQMRFALMGLPLAPKPAAPKPLASAPAEDQSAETIDLLTSRPIPSVSKNQSPELVAPSLPRAAFPSPPARTLVEDWAPETGAPFAARTGKPSRLWQVIGAGVAALIMGTLAILAVLRQQPPQPTPTSIAGGAAVTSQPFITQTLPPQISEIDGMTQIYIPAGGFVMGSSDSSSGASDDEKPQRAVYMDAFWIDQTHVTNAMFERFVAAIGYKTDAEKIGHSYVFDKALRAWNLAKGADWRHPGGPSSTIAGLENHPVVHISWNDATAYCQWAGRRLATEAEWEKAARGTDGRQYPWGNGNVAGNLLNFADLNLDADWADQSQDDGYEFTAPVGQYEAGASPYGVLDMAGNVWEWVADWYDKEYHVTMSDKQPSGPPAGETRVLRGGAWSNAPLDVRAANRNKDYPTSAGADIGLRCARSP